MENGLASVLKIFTITPTDLYAMLVFSVCFYLFYRLLASAVIKPFIELVEERAKRTTGAAASASNLIREKDEILAAIERDLHAARTVALGERAQKIKNASQNATLLIGKAEREAESFAVKAKLDLGKEVEALRKQSFTDIESLSREVTNLVLDVDKIGAAKV